MQVGMLTRPFDDGPLEEVLAIAEELQIHVHQGIDHCAPVSAFAGRIFHVHAKDTLIDETLRARVGILGDGWWRYVIPGFGRIHWGELVTHLRLNGYDTVLSVEHEDESQSREEGFLRGRLHLEPFC